MRPHRGWCAHYHCTRHLPRTPMSSGEKPILAANQNRLNWGLHPGLSHRGFEGYMSVGNPLRSTGFFDQCNSASALAFFTKKSKFGLCEKYQINDLVHLSEDASKYSTALQLDNPTYNPGETTRRDNESLGISHEEEIGVGVAGSTKRAK